MSGETVGEFGDGGASVNYYGNVFGNFWLRLGAAATTLPDELIAALSSIQAATAQETSDLESRHKQISKERAAVARELRMKKKREEKLMQKSSSKLSVQQLLIAAARKSNAKERAACNGKVTR